MGYPMTWQRILLRHRLHGGYRHDRDRPPERPELEMLCGDLRRLEQDQRDDRLLGLYARTAGITPEQVAIVFDCFFGDRNFEMPS